MIPLQVRKPDQDATEMLISAIKQEEVLQNVMPKSYKVHDAKNESFGRL